MYFYLNENCFFIAGAYNGAIYNVKEGNFFELDHQECEYLKNSEIGNPIESNELIFFKELESLDLGFLSQSKCFVDKIRLYSPLLVNRYDLNTPVVRLAYIKLNNICSKKCNNCNKLFCPICLLTSKENSQEDINYTKWIKVIDHLCVMGLKSIIFTGGDPLLYKNLDKLVLFSKSKNLNISIITPGLNRLPKNIPLDIQIILTAFDDNNYESLLKNFEGIKKIVMLYTEDSIYNKINFLEKNNIKLCKLNPSKHILGTGNLNPFNINSFFNRRDLDTCLLGKIYFDNQGDIVPCYNQIHQSLGNINYESLDNIIANLIINYWNTPLKNDKCSNCEYYFICPSCKFLDVKSKCNYDNINGFWNKY